MDHDSSDKPEIVIAGAGWSGLAAAVQLCKHGFSVNLLEAAQQAGGRARSIIIDQQSLDNGQHILLGAYQNVLKLLSLLNINEKDVLLRQPLQLNIHGPMETGIRIKTANLFSPMHILLGIMTAKGFSIYEKILLLRAMFSFRLKKFTINQDISVLSLLQKNKQTPRIIKLFWEPVCVAALNTQIDKASAGVFLQVLKKSFTGHRRNSDLLLPRVRLGQLMPSQAVEYIRHHNNPIHFNERVTQLIINKQGIRSVKTSKRNHACRHLILALPYKQSQQLLEDHDRFKQHLNMSTFEYEPVTTVYLQYPEQIKLKNNIAGAVDCTAQWLIDRGSCGQPGLIAAVISAGGPHQKLDKHSLTNKVISEITLLYPAWPAPLKTWLIREKQATFSCNFKTNHLRPDKYSLGSNIWLAGDFIDQKLPATLEAAVQAGLQCANQLIKQIKRT